MSHKGILLALLFAIFSALISKHFNIQKATLLTYQNVEKPNAAKLSGHHHHKQDKNKKTTTICNDFPFRIPTVDPNTTFVTCVDRNGCCNFTTVQAAVDSVGDFSPKRNIIWINNGIYL